MKKILFLSVLIGYASILFGQLVNYDIINYTPPAGWKKEAEQTSHVAYSRIDGGSWAQIAIYKSTASKGNIEADVQHEWNAIVLALRAVQNEESSTPATADGWSVMSRSGIWQYNGANVATILTTYSNGTRCFSILCNATAKPYLEEYKKFVASVHPDASLQPSAISTPGNAPSVVGLWASAVNEISGYSNGMALTSGGYFRKEYRFNADGTYQYRAKNWSVTVKDILFVSETGTYTINGNQLIISPSLGNGQWWSKAASGRTEGWGTYQKKQQHPLEKISYSFEIKYLSGMGEHYLVLKTNRATSRDGSQSNQQPAIQEFNYSRIDPGKSLIDTPPAHRN